MQVHRNIRSMTSACLRLSPLVQNCRAHFTTERVQPLKAVSLKVSRVIDGTSIHTGQRFQVGRTRNSRRVSRMLVSLADKTRTWFGKPLECRRNVPHVSIEPNGTIKTGPQTDTIMCDCHNSCIVPSLFKEYIYLPNAPLPCWMSHRLTAYQVCEHWTLSWLNLYLADEQVNDQSKPYRRTTKSTQQHHKVEEL